MKFNTQLVAPSYTRQADYNSLASTEPYTFICSRCSSSLSFEFNQLIGREYSWRNDYDVNEIEQIKSYFGMNLVGKTPDGGWPAILEIQCKNCRAAFVVYAGVQETSHSVYRVTVQSIAEIQRD